MTTVPTIMEMAGIPLLSEPVSSCTTGGAGPAEELQPCNLQLNDFVLRRHEALDGFEGDLTEGGDHDDGEDQNAKRLETVASQRMAGDVPAETKEGRERKRRERKEISGAHRCLPTG